MQNNNQQEDTAKQESSIIPAQKTKKGLGRRAIYILPNLFTTSSIFFAFLSIVFASQSRFEQAAYFIFLSAFLDGIDGKVARLTGTSSEFGVQYDSLADVIAFGMTPALLIWNWALIDYGRTGVGISFLFVACAALRLARFNVSAALESTEKKFFVGLPSPAAGCVLASFILFAPYTEHVPFMQSAFFQLGLCMITGLLMVSRVRYFSFKEFGWIKKHPLQSIVIVLLLFVLVFSEPRLFLFPLLFLFVLSGILYTYIYVPITNRRFRKSTFYID